MPNNISMGKVLVYISKVKVVINRRATYREVSKVLSNTLKQQQWSLNVRQNLPTENQLHLTIPFLATFGTLIVNRY